MWKSYIILQITIIALQENMLKFDIEKTIKYWRDGAKYDMDTAKALYEKTRYPSEQKAFYKKCTLLYTKAKMSELRKTYKWLKSQL